MRTSLSPIVHASSISSSSSSSGGGGGCGGDQEMAVRKGLRHAASHPAPRDPESLVNKRRLDWRNSHRSYRSTPGSTASRDANQGVTYEARRALRDHTTPESPPLPTPTAPYSCYGRSIPHPPSDRMDAGDANGSRRILPKRGGSTRECVSPKSDFSTSLKTWLRS